MNTTDTTTPTETCMYCERAITRAGDTWVNPEATGDDAMWRETCEYAPEGSSIDELGHLPVRRCLTGGCDACLDPGERHFCTSCYLDDHDARATAVVYDYGEEDTEHLAPLARVAEAAGEDPYAHGERAAELSQHQYRDFEAMADEYAGAALTGPARVWLADELRGASTYEGSHYDASGLGWHLTVTLEQVAELYEPATPEELAEALEDLAGLVEQYAETYAAELSRLWSTEVERTRLALVLEERVPSLHATLDEAVTDLEDLGEEADQFRSALETLAPLADPESLWGVVEAVEADAEALTEALAVAVQAEELTEDLEAVHSARAAARRVVEMDGPPPALVELAMRAASVPVDRPETARALARGIAAGLAPGNDAGPWVRHSGGVLAVPTADGSGYLFYLTEGETARRVDRFSTTGGAEPALRTAEEARAWVTRAAESLGHLPDVWSPVVVVEDDQAAA